MTVLRVVLLPVLGVLDLVLWLLMWVVIARAVISWVEPNPYNPIVRTLRLLTDPLLRPLQRLQWRLARGRLPVDLSPIAVILLIVLVRRFLAELQLVLLR